MSKFVAVFVLSVLTLGGAIGCGIKAILGIEQRRFLPKRLLDEYGEMEVGL